VEILASGLPRVLAKGFICEFRARDTTDWEREIARQTFTFRGVPHDESGVREIDPVPSRVSSFDTTEVPEEYRERVEARLLETQGPEDHILAVKPVVAPPWPTYDKLTVQGKRTAEMVAQKIAATVTEQGYDPELVASYERGNLNRPEVLAALSALSAEEAEELVVA
jgi:hypothetical protein